MENGYSSDTELLISIYVEQYYFALISSGKKVEDLSLKTPETIVF